MKFKSQMISVIIAFLVLFTYLYPIAFKILPFDTGILLHLIGFIYFLFYRFRHLDHRFCSIYLWTLGLLIIAWSATTVFNNAFDFGLLKKLFAIILYSFTAFLVIDLIKKTSSSFSFFTLLEWIIYVALAQAILSIILFLNPDLTNLYLNSIKMSEVAEDIAVSQSSFRLMAISKTQYANMAIMYGIALLGAITLAFSNKSVLYHHKFLYYISIVVIIIAGIFSARTFFLMLVFSFFYLWYLLWKRKGYVSILNIILAVSTIILFFLISMSLLENSENASTYKWMFEWYINLSENGTFETTSTNALKSMYIFPDNVKTWLIGDGRFQTDSGAFYKNTDVGYLRNLFYWGILGSILFYFVQYQYFKIVKNTTNLLLIRRFLGFIMIWVLVYNIKEFWYANLYWVLFLVALLKTKQ